MSTKRPLVFCRFLVFDNFLVFESAASDKQLAQEDESPWCWDKSTMEAALQGSRDWLFILSIRTLGSRSFHEQEATENNFWSFIDHNKWPKIGQKRQKFQLDSVAPARHPTRLLAPDCARSFITLPTAILQSNKDPLGRILGTRLLAPKVFFVIQTLAFRPMTREMTAGTRT